MPAEESMPPVLGAAASVEAPDATTQPGGTVVAPTIEAPAPSLTTEAPAPSPDGIFKYPEAPTPVAGNVSSQAAGEEEPVTHEQHGYSVAVDSATPDEALRPATEPTPEAAAMSIPVAKIEEGPQAIEVNQNPPALESALVPAVETEVATDHSESEEFAADRTETPAGAEATVVGNEEPSQADMSGPKHDSLAEHQDYDGNDEQALNRALEITKKDIKVLLAEFDELASRPGPVAAEQFVHMEEVNRKIADNLRIGSFIQSKLSNPDNNEALAEAA